MEYRHFEEILAKVHEVNPEDIGAFRARIRVLRTMGIPPVPSVGKGSRQEFSGEDLAEMRLALSMSEFGLSPARVAYIIPLVRSLGYIERGRDPITEWWLMLAIRANAGKLSALPAEDVLRIAIVETSALVRELEASGTPTWRAVLSLRRISVG